MVESDSSRPTADVVVVSRSRYVARAPNDLTVQAEAQAGVLVLDAFIVGEHDQVIQIEFLL